MKSQCCNAKIEVLKGGEGMFSTTTGSYTCSACRKFCARRIEPAKAPTKQGKKVKEIEKLDLSLVNLGTPGLALIDYGDKINELIDAVNHLLGNFRLNKEHDRELIREGLAMSDRETRRGV